MIISFLLPGPSQFPAGGYKMIFEYANRFARIGYRVNIIYAGSLFWQKKSVPYKFSGVLRYIQKLITGYSSNWFEFDDEVKEYLTLSLNYRHVPHSDIYVCSTPFTAMYLNSYPIDNIRKFYFVQGYENWGGVSDNLLRETYRYPFKKIAVSSWLAEIIKKESERCDVVFNGFDFKRFKCYISPSERSVHTVAMVYSPIECKGFKYGYEALKIVHDNCPDLNVKMFGTDAPPEDLPNWINYTKCPDIIKINEIYNSASIFIASSLQEGWGLTVGEAMICGAAVICSDNKGYLEMAKPNVTALVSPVCDSVAMAKNILRLMSDNALRYSLIDNAHKLINEFSLENSFNSLKRAMNIMH